MATLGSQCRSNDIWSYFVPYLKWQYNTFLCTLPYRQWFVYFSNHAKGNTLILRHRYWWTVAKRTFLLSAEYQTMYLKPWHCIKVYLCLVAVQLVCRSSFVDGNEAWADSLSLNNNMPYYQGPLLLIWFNLDQATDNNCIYCFMGVVNTHPQPNFIGVSS